MFQTQLMQEKRNIGKRDSNIITELPKFFQYVIINYVSFENT